ncbi:unnamed protein product [Protopolystoma xenopodis]|uniref:Uncharacterized protein n=1 Tax=Protopolystoma xenopodis TaxID=117903 RepID=A0A448X072_9PLAT|nr:unnamed protein product [Protopolystoma xenopodis]
MRCCLFLSSKSDLFPCSGDTAWAALHPGGPDEGLQPMADRTIPSNGCAHAHTSADYCGSALAHHQAGYHLSGLHALHRYGLHFSRLSPR